MARLLLPRHHKTHEPGGSDEIQGLRAMYPTYHNFDLATAVSWADLSGYTVTTDNTYWLGRYIGSTVQNSYIVLPCRLGPKGSRWSVDIAYAKDSTFGVASFLWGTAGEDSTATVYAGDPTGLKQASAAVGAGGTNVSYVTHPVGRDMYNATLVKNLVTSGLAEFRIGGSDGDVLTAFSTDPTTGSSLGDGGPGLYNLKIKMATISTGGGYGSALIAVTVRRIDEVGF